MPAAGDDRPAGPARRRARGSSPSVRMLLLLLTLLALGSALPAAGASEIAGFVLTTPVQRSLRALYQDWQSWKRAYYQADPSTASSALDGMLRIAGELGLERLPDLSVAAAAYAVRSAEEGDFERAAWVLDAARDLDPRRPETELARAAVRREQGDYLGAVASTARGYAKAARLPAERAVWSHNLLLWSLYLLLISGAFFVIVQMGAKGADLVHDLQRIVSPPLPFVGGIAIAFVLLLWPLLLPAGLLWLLCSWALLLWGYGTTSERVVLIAILILVGVSPLIVRAQQRAMQIDLAPPVDALAGLESRSLYGRLFTDLQVLRSLLPDEPAVAELESDLHRRLGQWEIARVRYHELLEREPANAAVANNLGVYYFRKQDFGSAITYFERATQADAQRVEAFFNLNRAYSQSYAFGEARQALAQAKELDGPRVDLWLEGEDAENRVVPSEGSARRHDEIRLALLDRWRAEVPSSMLERLRSDLSLSVVIAITLLAAVAHLLRRRFGYSFLFVRDPRPESLPSRLRRALIPGLASIQRGFGVRAFGGIALAVAIFLLPFCGDLGYRSRIAFESGGWTLVLITAVAFALLIVVRIGHEFTAEG